MSDPLKLPKSVDPQLPPQLVAIHDIFHISQLRKCIKTPTEIIESSTIDIQPDLSYIEHPIKVLDVKERSTRRETIKMYKIQWNHHTEEEATWETEFYLQQNFPNFLRANYQMCILFRGKAVTFRY
jgi:hypothetical protein